MKGFRGVEILAYLAFLGVILGGCIRLVVYAIRREWRKHP